MMNITYYRNFVKIVDTGTISGASRELYIAQPALSKQLKMMEEEYGVQLLTRGAQHVYPTNAGKILYDKAKRICLLEDAAQKEIESTKAGKRGTLRIGLTPATPDPLMETLLLNFYDDYPNVNFEIQEANSEPIQDMVKKGTVEIGVIRMPAVVPPIFDTSLCFKEHFMIAFHKQGPWLSEKMENVPFSELDGIPIATSRGLLKKVTDSCLEAGFTPHYLSVSSSRSKAFMWSTRGAAVTIFVGQLEKESPNPEICYRPLKGKNMDTQRSFITLKERKLSAVANLFLDFCKNHISTP